jgi:hypothetical protein
MSILSKNSAIKFVVIYLTTINPSNQLRDLYNQSLMYIDYNFSKIEQRQIYNQIDLKVANYFEDSTNEVIEYEEIYIS